MGDLKPSNIVVTFDEQIKIIDFGVAQPYGAGQTSERAVALISPGFSPPEQTTRDGLNLRSDLYSFGATLLWCLSGHDAQRSLQGLTVVQEKLGLSSLPLVRLMRQCLAISPHERPANVEVVEQALRQCLTTMRSMQDRSSALLAQLYQSKSQRVL